MIRAIVPGAKMTIVSAPASGVLHGMVVEASQGMHCSSAGSDAFHHSPTKDGVSTGAAGVALIAALLAFAAAAGLGRSGALSVRAMFVPGVPSLSPCVRAAL